LRQFVLGVKVKRFGLCWRGVYIVREAGTDWQNLLISLGGAAQQLRGFLRFAGCAAPGRDLLRDESGDRLNQSLAAALQRWTARLETRERNNEPCTSQRFRKLPGE
jgi:hypothetical protein